MGGPGASDAFDDDEDSAKAMVSADNYCNAAERHRAGLLKGCLDCLLAAHALRKRALLSVSGTHCSSICEALQPPQTALRNVFLKTRIQTTQARMLPQSTQCCSHARQQHSNCYTINIVVRCVDAGAPVC